MDPIIGEIRMMSGPKVPVNWHACDGSLLNINTYQALFSLLSTIYGGDGVTTFGIPDLRGRAIISQGTALSKTVYQLGQKGGVETVAITEATMPTHTHNFTVGATDGTASVPTGNFVAEAPAGYNMYVPETITGITMLPINPAAITNSDGGNVPHTNLQPYLPVNYMICLNGIYPQFPS